MRSLSRRVVWSLSALAVVAVLAGPAPAESIDHGPFDQLLAEHVRDGLVDYPAVAGDQRLPRYLRSLADVQPSRLSDRAEQLACYLNAYNAFSLKGVVDNWPVRRVTDIKGFFSAIRYDLGGQRLTLNELQNQVVRPLGDPRIHAALVCASASSPPLRSEAYRADRLDAQLDDQCRRWVNDATKNQVDREGRRVLVSQIFKWYGADFEAAGGPAGFLREHHADEGIREWLAGATYNIEYLAYDWSLNQRR